MPGMVGNTWTSIRFSPRLRWDITTRGSGTPISEKLGSIAANKPANSDIYTTAFAEWVETFATHAAPDYLPHLFWIDGGALAVENALEGGLRLESPQEPGKREG